MGSTPSVGGVSMVRTGSTGDGMALTEGAKDTVGAGLGTELIVGAKVGGMRCCSSNPIVVG